MKDKVYLIRDDNNPNKFNFVAVSGPLKGKNALKYRALMRSTFTEVPLRDVLKDETGIDLFNNLYKEFFGTDYDNVEGFDFVVISDLVPPEKVKFFKKNKEGKYEEVSDEYFNKHVFNFEYLPDEFAAKNHCFDAIELIEIAERRFYIDDSIQKDIGTEFKIIVDSKTGAQYLHYQGFDDKGQDGAAMCLLVDKDGKPLLRGGNWYAEKTHKKLR